MFKTEILFTGFYGQKNTGDDAFIEVSSWGADRYWKKNENIFLSKKENLPLVQTNIKGYPLTLPKSYHIQNKLLLDNTQYLISAGGSTLHSKMTEKNIKAMAVKHKKNGKKIKIGGIGVSIGPFKTNDDEKAIFNYLKNLDFLAVRDQASYDIVSQLDLPYKPINAFDLAALLPKVYSTNTHITQKKEKKIIGISVCPFESISDPKNIANEIKRNKMLCQLLQAIDNEENIHFKFFIINGHKKIGDYSLTKNIIHLSKLNSFEIIPYQKETRLMWNEIKSCNFIISTRLHAAIFACFADIPFMLNEYHRKCEDFLETIGYEESYRLYNSEYSIKEKSQIILEILNNKNYIIPHAKDLAIKNAELNFTKIKI
ncbi:MAG: polysaccharide pyruvyl transferase family protein [Advenella sp.]|nr:polysaccharide pyruvyl transferase family protein [Advenella sp.]